MILMLPTVLPRKELAGRGLLQTNFGAFEGSYEVRIHQQAKKDEADRIVELGLIMGSGSFIADEQCQMPIPGPENLSLRMEDGRNIEIRISDVQGKVCEFFVSSPGSLLCGFVWRRWNLRRRNATGQGLTHRDELRPAQ